MDKDKIIVSVVIDKQALVDRAFDISKNPSEFNEIKKVIDGKNQFTRDIDEFDDEGKKENNTNLFSNIALDTILSDNPELAITKRLNSLEDKKNSFLAKMKKLVVTLVTNENDERTTQTIIGSIQLSRQFEGFHINDGQLWKPVRLGDFFRLNRSFFDTKEKNMELVNLLKSFSAKVQTTIKKEYSDKIINTELDKIRKLCPEIPIMEV